MVLGRLNGISSNDPVLASSLDVRTLLGSEMVGHPNDASITGVIIRVLF